MDIGPRTPPDPLPSGAPQAVSESIPPIDSTPPPKIKSQKVVADR